MEDESTNKQPSNDIISSSSSSEEFSTSTNSHEMNNVTSHSTMDKPCACGKESCPSCNNSGGSKMFPSPYVYAIGKVIPRFPNKSLEMELAQAMGRKREEETKNLTRPEVAHKLLTDPDNRYIARQICYVLNIEGLETYILVPSDPLDIDSLAQAIRPAPAPGDVDVIIGRRGPIASPQMCNGLMVPIVTVDKIYPFDRDTLIKSIPKRKGESEEQFKKTAYAIFDHIIQIADNTGATDEHRALNYLSVRYDEIYHRTQLLQSENYSFTGVEVRHSPLSGTRKIVDVIFSYENRANRAIQKWFVRVDVTPTEEFPFLVSPLQEYFER
jgi:PatG C-terminal